MIFHSDQANVSLVKRRDESPRREALGKRILAIDTGDKRMGFAVWDPLSALARPLPVWERKGLKRDLQQIETLIAEEAIEAILVGIPFTDNTESPSLKSAYFWVDQLLKEFPLPLWTCDETMSSFEAEEALRLRAEKNKKGKRDSWSAAFFLEGFIRDASS
jgi:putative Holliday junction resolvase